MSWLHEPYKHKKRSPYKRKNWEFQVKGKFYMRHPVTGKRVIREGYSAWFDDYRDRKRKVLREEALNFAKSGRFYDYVVVDIEWSYVRWREVSERTYKKWKKKRKKKRHKK